MSNDFVKEDFKKYILSLVYFCEKNKNVKSTFFLNEIECFCAKNILDSQKQVGYIFDGCFLNSKRNILTIYSNNIDVDKSVNSPIVLVSNYNNKLSQVKHSTVLGSVMSLNIKRELIGDIIIDCYDRKIYLVCHKNAEFIICDELKKVGNIGVCFTRIIGNTEKLSIKENYELKTFVVSSKRVDVVVSAIIGCSRNVSSEFIKNKKVFLNYEEVYKDTVLIKTGDIITVRGCGKFIVDSADKFSKKGKVILDIKKYL